MEKGLIIYSALDKKRNQFFIDKIIDSFFIKYHIKVNYLDEEDIYHLDLNEYKFAIYRGRDYRINEYLENNNLITFNSSRVNKVANNKYLSYLLFRQLDLPCVNTYIDTKDIKSFPFVMKSISGHGGKEVYLCHSLSELDNIRQKEDSKQYIFQDYVPINGDIRIYLLGNKIISIIKRTSSKDFRFNYSLGGDISLYQENETIKNIVDVIYNELHTDFVGIDVFEKNNEYYLNEIEDPVGSRMLYQLTDIDIIDKFVDYIYLKINK
ncbi:MAG: RimK family alpha-L-glutamate ligase [Bacilli bacterium]